MCKECGCGEQNEHSHEHAKKHEHPFEIESPLGVDLLTMNNRYAGEVRDLLRRKGCFMVHLTSSPGSGKTTLLEKSVEMLKNSIKIGVIEGDVATENDAERIRKLGIPAEAITTDGACHLDAHSVLHALEHLLNENDLNVVFVENVGNLICPAEFYLGEDQRVVLVSATEGDDKPEKYPAIFRRADALVISKIDLLPYVDFNPEKTKKLAKVIAPRIKFFELSAKTGKGISEWVKWLKSIAL